MNKKKSKRNSIRYLAAISMKQSEGHELNAKDEHRIKSRRARAERHDQVTGARDNATLFILKCPEFADSFFVQRRLCKHRSDG